MIHLRRLYCRSDRAGASELLERAAAGQDPALREQAQSMMRHLRGW